MLWGRHEGAQGGYSLAGCGASGVGCSPTPNRSSLGCAARAHYPLAVGAGAVGVGTCHPPHRARSCELAFGAVGAARGRPRGGGATCLRVGRPGWGALPRPTARPWGVRPGPATHWHRARCAGLGPGCPWHLLPCRGLSCVVRASRVPGTRWPLLLGTCPCPVVPAGGVPLWRASWLRVGVLRLVQSNRTRCSGSFPVDVVPSPIPGAVTPCFTGWLRWVSRGGPRMGLIVPAAGPCRGRGAGRAPRRTRSGPRDGVVPGGSLRLLSWAACAAVVWRVCTPLLTRPDSRTVRLLTGDFGGAPGLFRVDADTSPSGRRTPHPGPVRVCLRVLFLARSGGPASRPRYGAPHLSCGRFVHLLCSALSGLGLPVLRLCVWFLCLFVCLLFFPCLFLPRVFPSPFSRPRCLRRFVLPGPWCRGPWRSSFAPAPPPHPALPPHLFFSLFFRCLFLSLSSHLPSCAPTVSGVLCFTALGALGLGALRLLLPPPPNTPLPPPSFLSLFFLCFFLSLSSHHPCRTPAVSGVLRFPAPGALGLGALRLLLPPPHTPFPPHFFPFFSWVCSFPFRRTSPLKPPLSPAFRASRPWVPWALALFVCYYPLPTPPRFFVFLCFFCPLLPLPAPPLSRFLRCFRPLVP